MYDPGAYSLFSGFGWDDLTICITSRYTWDMAHIMLPSRNRHIVAVISLLVSSVGGFTTPPQVSRAQPYHCQYAARSRLLRQQEQQRIQREPLTRTSRCASPAAHNRGYWDDTYRSSARFSGVPRCRGWGYGFGDPFMHALAGGSWLLSQGNKRSSLIPMSLNSTPDKHSKIPPGGESATGMEDSKKTEVDTPSPPTGKAVSPSSSGDPKSATSKSANSRAPKGASSGGKLKGVGVVPGVAFQHSTAEQEGNTTTVHESATRTDLNGSKTVSRRRRAKPASTTPISIPTGGGSTSGAVRKKRRLKRPVRSSTVAKEASESAKRARPLVVTDDMDLADVTSLVKEVLERVSETERELRRLRKEGSLPKTRSSLVRERKFVIDTRAKMMGAAFAGSLAGMVVGWSVLPNLWLLGAVVGAVASATLSRTTGTIGSICATCGIQVALLYKDVRDWWEQTVFLYKTGKLSYTYWKGFEKYDDAWGVTVKYNDAVSRVSKEAMELDRQYKIRAKALRAGKRLTKLSKTVGSSAAKEATQFASVATDWGGNQLRQWGLLGEDDGPKIKANRFGFGRLTKKSKQSGGVGGEGRPLGVSLDLTGIFGDKGRSLYSAPAAGGTRKPGYRGDPVIPARIRHLLMTPKQIREERLRKYRVGFMGMRIPRAFEKDD